MLAYAAVELSKIADKPRSMRSNALLESFAVHIRCLHEFLFGRRGSGEYAKRDAYATDFLPDGAELPAVPAALKAIDKRRRLGREVVHLSYDRDDVAPEVKDWPVSAILDELLTALWDFARDALPERLDEDTRVALLDLETEPPPGVGPISVATAIAAPYGGGTINLPPFSTGS
jgi:hypothetical protein